VTKAVLPVQSSGRCTVRRATMRIRVPALLRGRGLAFYALYAISTCLVARWINREVPDPYLVRGVVPVELAPLTGRHRMKSSTSRRRRRTVRATGESGTTS
jgi:hypothetical protein